MSEDEEENLLKSNQINQTKPTFQEILNQLMHKSHSIQTPRKTQQRQPILPIPHHALGHAPNQVMVDLQRLERLDPHQQLVSPPLGAQDRDLEQLRPEIVEDGLQRGARPVERAALLESCAEGAVRGAACR